MVRYIQNDEEIGTVQFPITETGTTSTTSFMIENNSEDELELTFWSEDGDITALEYPRHLFPHESKQAKLLFSPPKERPDALKAKWGFKEVKG